MRDARRQPVVLVCVLALIRPIRRTAAFRAFKGHGAVAEIPKAHRASPQKGLGQAVPAAGPAGCG